LSKRAMSNFAGTVGKDDPLEASGCSFTLGIVHLLTAQV